jgi:hypothetical protein
MMDKDRRNLVLAGGGLATGALLAGMLPVAQASAEEHAHTSASADGESLDAGMQSRCGTCQFWGGMRKISADHKSVFAQSLGWCNNPKSPNYGKLTNAQHEMTDPGIWTKWPALA